MSELHFRVSFFKAFTILLFICESVIPSHENNVQIFQISSGNNSLHSAQNAIRSAKPSGKIGKEANGGEITSVPPHGLPTNHEEDSRFHIFNIKPKHSIKRFVNQWNQRTDLFYSLPYSQHLQSPNNYQRRGFDSYYPQFYLSSRFNGYRNNAYQPHFHSNYENRELWKPAFSEENTDTQNSAHPTNSLPIKLQIFHKAFSEASSIEKISTIKTPTHPNPSKNYPETVERTQNKTLIKPLNVPTHSSHVVRAKAIYRLPLLLLRPIEGVSSNKRHVSNPGKFPNSGDILHSVENPILKFEQGNLASFDPHENENGMFSSDPQAKFERAILKNKTGENDFDLFANNRLYYDKVPHNLNDSWFLYVNCSRESCQFTNSTNETELIKEGWVVHNCTKQGCTEIYPKTEAIRKFIGLMLLVFSLCILKIVAFVLLFYYCRKIKLSKQGAEDQNSMSSDDDKKDPIKNHELDINKEITVVKQMNGSELTFSEQKTGSNIAHQQEIKPLSSLLQGVGSNGLKIWKPPVQRVSSCLTEPGRDILTPTKHPEKIVLNLKHSDKLLKNKSKNGSKIPRLEKLVKYSARKGHGLEKKQMKNKNSLEDSKRTKPNTAEGELLLMNLDDDSCYPNSCSAEKGPKWEDMLKNECESFVSIDINEDDHCKQ